MTRVETEPTFARSAPQALFGANRYLFSDDWSRSYDIALDGQRFLMLDTGDVTSTDGAESRAGINVVLNWFEELKRLVPVP